MDADTRANSAVMAYVGPRGATAADLRKALGWPWERLEAVLRDLVRSRVLMQTAGRFYPVAAVTPKAPTEAQQRQAERSRKAAAASLEKSRAEREARYREILALRDQGLCFAEISRRYGRSDMRETVRRAVRWRAGGGK